MNLFLDTEFNGFQGKLLSIALVPQDSIKPEFYKELICDEEIDPWVKNNVMPHMTLTPCSILEYQQQIQQYLLLIGDCTIIADWPDDIKYFCESLITGPGKCVFFKKINFILDTSIRYNSEVPHNALWDARAIRDHYIKKQTTGWVV